MVPVETSTRWQLDRVREPQSPPAVCPPEDVGKGTDRKETRPIRQMTPRALDTGRDTDLAAALHSEGVEANFINRIRAFYDGPHELFLGLALIVGRQMSEAVIENRAQLHGILAPDGLDNLMT